MTVIKLRDALNALIEQGHGELPVAFVGAGICDAGFSCSRVPEYEPVEWVTLKDRGDENVPGPLIEIE